MRTANRANFAFKFNEKVKEYFQSVGNHYYDTEECKIIDSFNDFQNLTDYYDSGEDLNITHHRTNTIDFLSFIKREALNTFRKDYENSTYLKKPTDIIIFTDAYSYSATSGFITSSKNAGSAIIVGYFGNPKITGTDLFDGSQSISSVVDLSGFYLQQNLLKLGYYIDGVTYSESYDSTYRYQAKNEIPLEYSFGQVDERVNIYSPYSDDIYNKFIEEGKIIFDKYNNKGECNPKNKRLLMHNDTCETIDNIEKAHGGYQCDDNGKWNEATCYPYYCDIGYYYARDENQCIKECHLNDSESRFLYKKKDDNYTITVNKTYFFCTVQRENYYFVFESEEDIIDLYPRIVFFSDSEEVAINKEKKIEDDVQLKIFALTSNTIYQNLVLIASYEMTILYSFRYIVMFKPSSKHVVYLKSLYNLPIKNIRTATLTSNMTYEDIENSNDNYFENYDGNLFFLEEKVSYIFEINYNSTYLDQIQIFINPTEAKKIIDIKETKTNYLYLKKNRTYKLNIKDDIGRAIKLSRKTNNSEVVIEDANITLNSKNLYYEIEQNFTGNIVINVNNEDAFIEFIYKISSVELDFEKREFKHITNKYNLIKIPTKYASKDINFEINGDNGTYSIFKGYSIRNYTYYTEIDTNNRIKSYNLNFDVKEPYENIELMDGEYYTILIVLYENSYLDIKINIQNDESDKSDTTEDNSNGKKGLPIWAIILIVVGALVVIALVVIIIFICRSKQTSNKEIEEKMEGLTEMPQV